MQKHTNTIILLASLLATNINAQTYLLSDYFNPPRDEVWDFVQPSGYERGSVTPLYPSTVERISTDRVKILDTGEYQLDGSGLSLVNDPEFPRYSSTPVVIPEQMTVGTVYRYTTLLTNGEVQVFGPESITVRGREYLALKVVRAEVWDVGENTITHKDTYWLHEGVGLVKYRYDYIDYNVKNPIPLIYERVLDVKLWTLARGSDNAGGKRFLDWFGSFVPLEGEGDGWIDHHSLGPVYCTGNDTSSIWMWNERIGWFWTSENIYPVMYSISENDWLWYHEADNGFITFTGGKWITNN